MLYLRYKTGLYTDPIKALGLLCDYRASDQPNSLWVDFNLSKCYIRCQRFVLLRQSEEGNKANAVQRTQNGLANHALDSEEVVELLEKVITRSQDETYFSYHSDDPEATFNDDHCLIGKANYLIAELFKIQGSV